MLRLVNLFSRFLMTGVESVTAMTFLSEFSNKNVGCKTGLGFSILCWSKYTSGSPQIISYGIRLYRKKATILCVYGDPLLPMSLMGGSMIINIASNKKCLTDLALVK